jgi:hypothetical protein
MFETYRMLGEQREAELLREARRLHASQGVRRDRLLRTRKRRLLSVFGNLAVALLTRLRCSTTPLSEIPERE